MIGCRVDCDFCPQTLLMDKYSSRANIENVSYGNPSFMSFDDFKTCLDKIPKEMVKYTMEFVKILKRKKEILLMRFI